MNKQLRLARASVDDRLDFATGHLAGHIPNMREALAKGSTEEAVGRLEDIARSDPEVDHTALASYEGFDLHHYPAASERPGQDYRGTHWYRDYVRGGRKPTVSDLTVREGTERVIVAATSFEAPGYDRPLTLYAALKLDSLRRWLTPFRLGDGGGMVLVDRHDRVVVASSSLKLDLGERYSGRCGDCLKRTVRVSGGWRLMAIQPRAEIREQVLASLLLPFFAGGALLVISGLAAMRIDRLNRLAFRQQQDLVEAEERLSRNFHELEKGLLPHITPIRGWEFGVEHASATTGAHIGGDFFDLVPLSEGRLAVIMGDVSGKGLSSASLASLVRTTARAFLESGTRDPAEVLHALNRLLIERTPPALFVTFMICVAEATTMKITSAGHPPPLVYDRDGKVWAATGPHGPALGVFPNAAFTSFDVTVAEGYTALFYTDGLTEARGPEGLFGINRVEAVFKEALREGRSPEQATRELLSIACDWSQGNLTDDIGILCVRPS